MLAKIIGKQCMILLTFVTKAGLGNQENQWNLLQVFSIYTILGLLVKEKSKRLPLTQILEHPWITKFNKGIREMRLNAQSDAKFKFYSHQQPQSPKILDEIAQRTNEDLGGN